MQLKQAIRDALNEGDRAVSPVIGVILMVAITVILAAVIGTFVLGLGDQVQNTAPQASMTFDFDESSTSAQCSLGSDGDLTVTHDGGDKLNPAQVNITNGSSQIPWDASGDTSCSAPSDDITAGTSMDATANSDATIRVIWKASGGGDTATLGKWTGPDA